MIRLALADDQVMFRRGLVMLLGDMPDVYVVFECSNGEELLTGLQGNAVDIVLLDLAVPGTRGFDGLLGLRTLTPKTPIVVVSALEDPRIIHDVMGYGAAGFISKSASRDDIDTAMKEGVQVETLVHPVKIYAQDGQLSGIDCVRNTLGDIDASGRGRPVPLPGTEFHLPLDTLIVAIGERPDSECLAGMGINIEKDGRVAVDPDTLCTCLLYTSPSPRDRTRSRMPSSA
mgnify:CR=1 FL=1